MYRNPFDDDDTPATPAAAPAEPLRSSGFASPAPAFSAQFDEFALLSQPPPSVSPRGGGGIDFQAAFKDLSVADAAQRQPSSLSSSSGVRTTPTAVPQGLPQPKQARTLRRNQLPEELRQRQGSIEKAAVAEDAAAAPVSAPPPRLVLVSAAFCCGLRGPPRGQGEALSLGDEATVRLEVAGFAPAAGVCNLLVRTRLVTAAGAVLHDQTQPLARAASLGGSGDVVEVAVALALYFESHRVGPCVLSVAVSDAANAASPPVTFSQSFELRDWRWGVAAPRLLVGGQPFMPSFAFVHQAVDACAIVTIARGMEGVPPEATLEVGGATLACQVTPHPSLVHCYAVHATAALAKPGAYAFVLTVRHPARPKEPLRHELQLRVVPYGSE